MKRKGVWKEYIPPPIPGIKKKFVHFDLEQLRNLREFEGSALCFFLLLVYVGFFGALSALGQPILFFLLSLSSPCRRGQRSDRKEERREEEEEQQWAHHRALLLLLLLGARKIFVSNS